MGNTAKLIIYVLLAGLGPALVALEHAEPGWSWVATAASIIAAIGAGVHVDPPATRERMAKMTKALGKVGLTAMPILLLAGCAWFTPAKVAATETAGIDLAVCVLNHAGESVQQIVTDCGAAAAEDVLKILDAHRAAMAREGK